MSLRRLLVPLGLPPGGLAEHDPWAALRGLVRYRLLVAAVALPVALQLWPDAPARGPWLLVGALATIGAASALFELGTRLRRGFALQLGVQLAFDVLVITALAALSGGQGSQFVMFYVLAILTGGFLGGIRSGVLAATLSCVGFLLLPSLFGALALPSDWVRVPRPPSTNPGLFVAFLFLLGWLTGYLGQRAHATHERLAQTRRELLRVRLDTDKILQHLTTGVLTVDAAGQVVYLNVAAQEVLQLEAAAVRGATCREALDGRLAPLRDRLLRTLQTGRPETRVELQMHRRDGSGLPVGCTTNVLSDQGSITGVVAVFQDLTEVREMERRVRRSETLAAVGQLAAGIAHEIGNGLKPISGSVECLQRELKLTGENERLMQLVGVECERLNRFVTELLSYSRDREVVPEEIDLEKALSEVCDLARRDPRCKAGVRVRTEAPGAPVLLTGDREQLRQVWLNLVVNALEAMEQGGTLVVRWSVTASGEIDVEFVDDGTGIAAEDLPRIGQPFFTTKQGGTGLGIAIAQRIVERHGGQLAFVSAPRRGTVARVTLPRERTQVAQAA
jgi:PAS domain S-box-containing protein